MAAFVARERHVDQAIKACDSACILANRGLVHFVLELEDKTKRLFGGDKIRGVHRRAGVDVTLRGRCADPVSEAEETQPGLEFVEVTHGLYAAFIEKEDGSLEVHLDWEDDSPWEEILADKTPEEIVELLVSNTVTGEIDRALTEADAEH